MIALCHELVYTMKSVRCTIANYLCPSVLKERDVRSRGWPLAIRLVLLADNAIELTFIATYHPMTLLYGMPYALPFPSGFNFLAQLTGFFVVESVLQRWIPAIVLPQKFKGRSGSGGPSDDDAAFRLAIEYIIPKATSIVAIGLFGNRFMLGIMGGPVHFCTVAMWAALRQPLFYESYT